MPNRMRSYNSDHLRMLTSVLHEALTEAVDSSAAPMSDAEIQELGARLGKVIMDSLIDGETDPERLKAIALESIQRR